MGCSSAKNFSFRFRFGFGRGRADEATSGRMGGEPSGGGTLLGRSPCEPSKPQRLHPFSTARCRFSSILGRCAEVWERRFDIANGWPKKRCGFSFVASPHQSAHGSFAKTLDGCSHGRYRVLQVAFRFERSRSAFSVVSCGISFTLIAFAGSGDRRGDAADGGWDDHASRLWRSLAFLDGRWHGSRF